MYVWLVEKRTFGVMTSVWKKDGYYTEKEDAQDRLDNLEIEGWEVRMRRVYNRGEF